jgi:hypothetical protein
MLQRVGNQISECLERAAQARRQAELTGDAGRKAEFLAQARGWSNLAQSLQFAETVDCFLCGGSEAAEGWQPIDSAPFDRLLELAVIDRDGTHTLVFPCCRDSDGWTDAGMGQPVDVVPTHWREWVDFSARGAAPQGQGGEAERAPHADGLLIFANAQGSLRVAQGENESFELVTRMHGEEVTVYDLDRDSLATIGRRLLSLAARA